MANTENYQEIDLSKAMKGVLRKWPLLLVIIFLWLLLANIFIKAFPPFYETKMTILVEEPQRMNDPLRYVVGPQDFNPPDDEFFVNEKVIVKSYPLVRNTLDSLNAMVSYKVGGLFKKDIYRSSPIEIDIQPISGKNKDQIEACQISILLEQQGGVVIESINSEDEQLQLNKFVPFGSWNTFGDLQLKFKERKGNTMSDLTQLWVHIDPIHELVLDKMEDLDVDAPDFQATIMELKLLGNNPDKDITFLNLLGSLYLDHHLSSKTEMLRKSMSFLENELELSGVDMENSEQKLVNFKSINEITNLSAESKILLAQTTKYQNQKLGLVVNRKYYNYLKNYLEDSGRFNQIITPQAFSVNDNLTNELVSQLVSLQKRKDNYENSGNTSNPTYQKIVGDIHDLKNDILENIRGFISSNEIRMADIDQKIAELSSQSRNIPAEEKALLQLNRAYELNLGILQDLQKKKFDVELSIASTIPDFEIVEPAFLTDTSPVFPNTIITYGAASFLALSSFFFWLLITGIFTNTIKAKEDIKALNGESVIHNVFKSNIKNSAELAQYPLSVLGENLKGILTNFNINNDHGRGIFGVYSHSPKEGKTYIASQMATMLALNGHKTILVDLDLQNPNAHKQLLLDPDIGASEYFAGEANLREIIHSTDIDNLKLITGGKYRLLQIPEGHVSNLLDQLSVDFDYIVLDTSPVGMDASMRSVMTYCDMNFFILTRSQTRKESIEQIGEIVAHIPKQKLNYIFNKAPLAESHFRTYQNYYRNKPRTLYSRLFSWT